MTVQRKVPRFCMYAVNLWLKPVSATGAIPAAGMYVDPVPFNVFLIPTPVLPTDFFSVININTNQ